MARGISESESEKDQFRSFAARFKNAGEAWDVALQIAALREQAGLSQKELAKLLKTSQQQISRLESRATKATL
ncbi:MAG: helix-turn-helix domain-containing protein [Candidatus Binatia bacterium]